MALLRFLPFAIGTGLLLYWRWSRRDVFGDFTHVVVGGLSALLWVVTVFVQLRPMLKIDTFTVSIGNYGLWSSDIALNNVKNVTYSGLGPLGIILDLRTKKNLSVREFVVLANVSKDRLTEILSKYGIPVA